MKTESDKGSILSRLKQLNRSQAPLNSKETLLKLESCNMINSTCQLCRGHGVVFSPRGFHAHADLCSCVLSCRLCLGKALDVSSGTAKPCQTPSPTLKANLFNKAQIPVRYARARIDNFNNDSGNYQEIITKVRRWLDGIDLEKRPLEEKGFILAGGVGVGKTYLLTSIAKELIFKGLSVKFIDFFQIITEIKSRYAMKKEVDESIIKPLLAADVLAIDEIGKGRRTDFEQMVIDQIVMGRYNQQKMILATSNCSLENTESQVNPNTFNAFPTLKTAVGDRIYSRLSESCEFWSFRGGDDYRFKSPRS